MHILVILGFLVYIPGSKHLHMLAAIPNVFLKPIERPKSPCSRPTSKREGAQTYGLGKVSDLSWKAVLDLYAAPSAAGARSSAPRP